MQIEALTGDELEAKIPALTQLRIEVFRDYPYLYEGTLEYEAGYLRKFTAARGAVIVCVSEGEEVVGVSTGAPLATQLEEFRSPFQDLEIREAEVFYCGESVLRSEYRGRGIGHRFFDEREARARDLGLRYSTFCAVVRSDDHPRRPADYRPLDPFWRKRGYEPLEGVVTELAWPEVGVETETTKTMQFWLKALA